MRNNNSFALKSFFEQWLPRLIALSVFAYLIYSLIFREDTFSGLHIGALAIILALILAPMASRLKLLNFIDFSSKLNDLKQEQQETKSHLSELRNQISTVISMRVSPIQISTLGGSEVLRELFSNFRKTEREVDSAVSIEKDTKYTKEEFLRRAYSWRSRAHTILFKARAFQIAILEHRFIDPQDYKGSTLDERIRETLDKILDNGLEVILPIRLAREHGEVKPLPIEKISENLRLLNTILDLRRKVENNEIEHPKRSEADGLFERVEDSLRNVSLSQTLIASDAIIRQFEIMNKIKELKKEFGIDNSKSPSSD